MSRHVAGPTHTTAGILCESIVAECRRIRRDEAQSPVAHALARAVHYHAVLPFIRSTSAAAADLSCVHDKHENAESSWLDIGSSLQRVVASTSTPSQICTAANVLSCIADEMKILRRATHTSHILNAIWQDVFASYSVHLRQWLNSGTVLDASSDFFICRNVDSAADGLSGMPPGHTFCIAYQRLPSFVTHEIAESIFFAGHVVNCFLRFDIDVHLTALPAKVDSDVHRRSKGDYDACGRRSCVDTAIHHIAGSGADVGLSVEAASIMWRSAASARMSRLMPHSSITKYLRSLREYLLLGSEQFWRAFFSHLRSMRHLLQSDMKQVEVNAAEQSLEHIVDVALADTSSNSEIPCILRFAVESDGQLSPCFDLPFPASAVITNTAGKYSQAFSVAFGVRGVVYALEQCYRSIVEALRRPVSCDEELPNSDRTYQDQRFFIQKCALLRMRMSRFMQAFDDYLQVDVFETGFQWLLNQLERAEDTRGSCLVTFDAIVAAHTSTMDRWLLESFADSDAIQRRLKALFETCFGLCELTDSIISGKRMSSHQGYRLEAAFDRNAELLIRMFAGLQGRIGSSKVSILLMKTDWDSFYQNFREGDALRQIFAQD